MNKKDRNKLIEDNRQKYILPSGAPFQYRSKNAIYISTTNRLNHEIAKCVGAYMIKKYGDFKFTDRIIGAIKILEESVKEELKDFPKNPCNFITECVPKTKTKKEKGVSEKDRRIDLVKLEDETWIEFENSKKERKERCITIYL